MSQLVNFIPKTFGECKALLKELNANRDGYSLADRYGNIDVLNAEEIKDLIGLLENHIGEKAQNDAPAKTEPKVKEEPAAEAQVKKSNKKSTKK